MSFMFSNTTNDTALTPANIAIGVILPSVGGILNALFIVTVPIITGTLRKFMLWDFENIWFIFSFFAFLIYPTAAMFGIVPFNTMQAYVNNAFDPVDWIGPCFLIAIFTVLGISFYAWSVSLSGIGISSLIVFGLFPVITTFANWGYDGTIILRYMGNDGYSMSYAIVFTVGAFIVLIGVVLAFVATVFAEKHHRYKRKEIEQGVLDDVAKDRERFNVTDSKAVKQISEKRMAILYWIGIAMAFVSGISFFLLPMGTYMSTTLLTKMTDIGGMTYFQAKVGITTIGFALGFCLTLALTVVFLIAKRTAAKFAIFSGGAVALFSCVNFKAFRLLGFFLSIVIAALWYGSYLLLLFGETQLTALEHQESFKGLPNIQFSLYAAWTVMLTMAFSGALGEFKSTKKPERIMMPIAAVLVVVGLVMISYGGYPADT
jgi:hypothetical protein